MVQADGLDCNAKATFNFGFHVILLGKKKNLVNKLDVKVSDANVKWLWMKVGKIIEIFSNLNFLDFGKMLLI